MTLRLKLTINYFISVVIAYALMLCVMSYNGGVFVATILGLTTGHFVFSYLKNLKEKDMAYFMRDYTQPVMQNQPTKDLTNSVR